MAVLVIAGVARPVLAPMGIRAGPRRISVRVALVALRIALITLCVALISLRVAVAVLRVVIIARRIVVGLAGLCVVARC